jgi:uncharacterized DUF497 family protein
MIKYFKGIWVEWDVKKNKINFEKHGIDFETAGHVFNNPYIEMYDADHSVYEDRYIAIGIVRNIYLYVVYTPRRDCYRLISARKAKALERRLYDQENICKKR